MRTVPSRDQWLQILHADNVLAGVTLSGVHRWSPIARSFRGFDCQTENVLGEVLVLPTGTAVEPADIELIDSSLLDGTRWQQASKPLSRTLRSPHSRSRAGRLMENVPESGSQGQRPHGDPQPRGWHTRRRWKRPPQGLRSRKSSSAKTADGRHAGGTQAAGRKQIRLLLHDQNIGGPANIAATRHCRGMRDLLEGTATD
jgi:hypothetical protein